MDHQSQSPTIKTINGYHHFTVKGYSLCKGIGVDKHIASDTFSVVEYQWVIYSTLTVNTIKTIQTMSPSSSLLPAKALTYPSRSEW
ncbi:hypothetical protein Ddye_026060 [Dipteronia dyeriana]|uniref:Uncharacterized protein n=1 Tax=Dipteronia dyeriana TaxID=168575 RepID=A0AAD9WQ65_9ROSI|nr:hypothetical protein Ddye_026060 [Dipteronia dyeriana]